jgi:hypothetical protein
MEKNIPEMGSSNPSHSSSTVSATVSSTVSTPLESSNAMTGMTMASSVSSPTPSTPPGFSQASYSPYQSSFRAYPLPSSALFGMPTTLMSGLQNFPHVEPETYIPSRVTPQTLTNTSMASLRQQMDESNHEMVNILNTQIGTVFNPLIKNTNESYQMLAYQMS